MKVSEQIKFIRTLRGWTQENMAHKLGISTHAYAKIERGETDVNLSRLEQIAQVMEIELPRLLELNDKNVFNSTGNHIAPQCNFDHWQVSSSSTEQTEYQHELEKAHSVIEQQKTEIASLKQQETDLIAHMNKQTDYQHELEKADLVIEQQKTEIDYLKQQVSDLRDMIELVKKQQ
jgi:transcriptional regulator with XRE-family HTH domain